MEEFRDREPFLLVASFPFPLFRDDDAIVELLSSEGSSSSASEMIIFLGDFNGDLKEAPAFEEEPLAPSKLIVLFCRLGRRAIG